LALGTRYLTRILYFSRDYTTHDHRFLSALSRTEHQVFYLRLERARHAFEDRPLPPQIEIVEWAGGQAPASWRDGPRLLSSLKKVLRRIQPDLVQAGPLQRCAFLAAASGFRPLVSMSWGYDLIQDARRNALWCWATRYTLKRSAAMVGDCNTIRQLAVSYGIPDERIVTFPWGVDLRHFSPPDSDDSRTADRARAATTPFVLLSTRSWEPMYGVDVIARAFVQAAQQIPELQLVMLGNGSQASMLHQIFQRGGVEERVHFPGQVGQNDLPRFYRSADLYLSASHSDGTSISLLEALACARPALVSDIPGNREWITPGVEGWLFTDGDETALAEAIAQAANDRPRLEQMGKAARHLAEQRADWEKNFPQLFKAYELALNASLS
jgi:glycosyltransferase involved in cell wall biosynthesis